MRLENKETGIIGELHFEPDKEYHFKVVTEDPADVMIYKKLADLYADWEDYEEPKGTYFINTQGDVQFWDSSSFAYPNDWTKEKEIGNYFETREEAELAVRKLKAWKRLKDKGFKFVGWDKALRRQEPCDFVMFCDFDGLVESEKDLDLLFRR